MSRSPSPFTPKGKLNNLTPGAKEVGLGDICNDVIVQTNNEVTDIAAARCSVLSSPGLVIKAGGQTIPKAGSAFSAVTAGGALVIKPANTDMSALAGTLATAKSAAWAFYIDATGTITTSAKTADAANAAAAAALLPAVPAGKAMIGFITIDNASGSNFVGGTTALDAASITTTYYNTVGPVGIGAQASAAITDLSLR